MTTMDDDNPTPHTPADLNGGTSHRATPLDFVDCTRRLTAAAVRGERVALVSERHDGAQLVAVGYVTSITHDIVILSRSGARHGHEGGGRKSPPGETFVRLAGITAIHLAPRRRHS